MVAPGVVKVTWGQLNTTYPAGDWVSLPQYPDKTVEVFGTFGAGAAIVMQGKGDGSTAVTLNDTRGEGNPAIIGDNNALTLNENPRSVRPLLTNGDGNTDITVVMTCM